MSSPRNPADTPSRQVLTARPFAASALVFGLGIALAVLTSSRGLLSADGAVRTLRATQVWFGGMPSIRSLGFDLPPLPTLLELPLVLMPGLRSNALAGAIVASLAAVLLGWSLLRALRGVLGLGGWAAGALTAATLLNPMLLYAVATGAGEVLGVALLVLGVGLVLDGVHDERNSLALFGGALAIGLPGLAQYELLLVAAGLTLAVAVLLGRQPGQHLAYAIAFGTPAASILGLWLLVNGLATGNPLSFVGHTAPATSATHQANGNGLAQFVLLAPPMIVALPGAGVLLTRGDRQARPALLVVLIVAALCVAGWIAVEALAGGSPRLLSGLALAPLSVLLLAEVVRPLRGDAVWPVVIAAAALACVVAPFASLSSRDEPGEGYASFVAVLTGQAVLPMWRSEQGLALTLREQSQGRDVLLDDRVDVLPAFFVQAPGHLIATADPDFPAVLSDPRGRARLILVQTPGTADDAINAAWPRLYAGGVPWAQQVGEWPVSSHPSSRYRLFEVKPA